MIHFRQLLARCNSSFIQIFSESKHYRFIYSCSRIRKHFALEIVVMSRHICSSSLTRHYLYEILQLLVRLKYCHVPLNQTKNLSWDHDHYLQHFQRIISLFANIFGKMFLLYIFEQRFSGEET